MKLKTTAIMSGVTFTIVQFASGLQIAQITIHELLCLKLITEYNSKDVTCEDSSTFLHSNISLLKKNLTIVHENYCYFKTKQCFSIVLDMFHEWDLGIIVGYRILTI